MSEILNGADIPSVPSGVKVTQLENGLTIIVREDHSAPVVSAQAWCMAGSIHEGNWLGAGMSHVLEHMLFKGTTNRPGSRIDQEVQEAGGYMNAYTSFDRTVYHIDVPNSGARVAIDILCDIMQNASLPPDEMEKEKQVIVREMDMNIDDPGRRSSRRLFETAYTRSPYRFTVIGYPDIFHELKPEHIRSYYEQQYAPNNVFYVVVGDIRHDEVTSQIRQAYAKSKARAMPPVVLPSEPAQTAPREIIEEAPIELAYFHFAFHIPELRHPDVPALDVLAVLLGSGRSSRLYQSVREKQGVVSSVDAWTYSPGDTGLFGMSAVAEPNKFEAARHAMVAELEKMKREAVSAAEIGKAVKQFTSATLASRKTMQGQAQDLGGSWLAANDLNFSQRYLAAVRKVTPADLQRVANKYLVSENRSLYALLPKGSMPSVAITTETSTDNAIRKVELPNGLRLLLKEDHRLPFIEFRAVFRGGVLAETPENNGITQLTSRLLLKGTKTRSAEDIAREIESVGGSIDNYGGNNSFGLNLEVLSSDVSLGLDLLSDVILNPAFPEAALEREREVQLAAIRSQKDHLLQSAFKLMRRGLFGERAYGLDTLGTEGTVGTISRSDILSFYPKMARPEKCVISIFGDINPEQIEVAVNQRFGQWRSPSKSVPDSSATSAFREIKRITEQRDKKQAVVVVGFPGTTILSPDRYALELLQESCSDLGSRLFLRIREELGLAYFVGAQAFTGLVPGYFAFYAGTLPEKAKVVEEEILKEAELLRARGLSAEELQRAKAKILGQKKIARQDLGSLAMTTALDELYGLGYNHSLAEDALYEGVTADEIVSAAQKHLTPQVFVVATIEPEPPKG
jgi:zinc protease